jgi:hypothetical protein
MIIWEATWSAQCMSAQSHREWTQNAVWHSVQHTALQPQMTHKANPVQFLTLTLPLLSSQFLGLNLNVESAQAKLIWNIIKTGVWLTSCNINMTPESMHSKMNYMIPSQYHELKVACIHPRQFVGWNSSLWPLVPNWKIKLTALLAGIL